MVRQLLEGGPQYALAVDRWRDARALHKAAQKASGLLRTQIIAQIFGLASVGIGDTGGKSLIVIHILDFGRCIKIGERKAEAEREIYRLAAALMDSFVHDK